MAKTREGEQVTQLYYTKYPMEGGENKGWPH